MDNKNVQKALHDTTTPTYLKHAGELLASLDLLRCDTVLCDVRLQAQEESAASGSGGVWAHRAVLAAASPYFYTMFTGDFKERTTQTVIIKGVELETLQELVKYIYSPASLEVTVENAEALLAAATMLNIAGLCNMVCAFLTHTLAVDNVLSIRIFAELHSCSTLVIAATEYMYAHAEQVLEGQEILALGPDELATLLDSNRLVVTEDLVLDAVLRWIRHRPQERKIHLSSLLSSVRLSLVPTEILEDCAQEEPLVSAEPEVLAKIMEYLSVAREPPAALLVMGGWTNTGCSNSVMICSLPGGRWRYVADLPAQRSTAGAAVLDDRVHVVGGWDGYSPVSTAFVYNVAIDSWSLGPDLTTARKWPGVAALASRLYTVGGWNGTRTNCIRLNSVEALDPREGRWRPVASMVTSRSALGVAALNECLYAVGGYNGNALLKSTERYDPRADRWETAAAMAEKRSGAGVAVLDDAMYAVGGWGGSNPLRSVERYHVDSGWETVTAMVAPRYNAAVAAHDGQLYVAGGRLNHYLTSVSVLDPAMTNSRQSELAPLPLGRDVAAAIVVPWLPAP